MNQKETELELYKKDSIGGEPKEKRVRSNRQQSPAALAVHQQPVGNSLADKSATTTSSTWKQPTKSGVIRTESVGSPCETWVSNVQRPTSKAKRTRWSVKFHIYAKKIDLLLKLKWITEKIQLKKSISWDVVLFYHTVMDGSQRNSIEVQSDRWEVSIVIRFGRLLILENRPSHNQVTRDESIIPENNLTRLRFSEPKKEERNKRKLIKAGNKSKKREMIWLKYYFKKGAEWYANRSTK